MITNAVFLAFSKLGIFEFNDKQLQNDPTTEEEFDKIDYPNKPLITWEQFQTEYNSVKQTLGKIKLRKYRDFLLQKCDWIMVADVYETIQNKSEWIAYRQALRDLPETQTVFVWDSQGELDFTQMNIPVQPKVIRQS